VAEVVAADVLALQVRLAEQAVLHTIKTLEKLLPVEVVQLLGRVRAVLAVQRKTQRFMPGLEAMVVIGEVQEVREVQELLRDSPISSLVLVQGALLAVQFQVIPILHGLQPELV